MRTDTDVVVVGGGIAAFTAAARVAREGHACTIYTGAVPGGLLLSIESVQGLPEHPEGWPGYELCPMTQEEAMDAGVQFVPEEAAALAADGERWVVRGGGAEVRARCVILAPGGRLRTLGVPGEERLHGRGVSHCASCDAPMLRGRVAAVIGGGDAACQEALTVAQHVARVHLLVRGASLRARAAWRERVAAEPKIVPRYGVQVEAIEGDDTVQAVKLRGGESIPVDAVFVYAGIVPATEIAAGVLPLDAEGRIVVDEALRTAQRGVLAAGIARSGSSGQAADALADGATAAASAHDYLARGAWGASA